MSIMISAVIFYHQLLVTAYATETADSQATIRQAQIYTMQLLEQKNELPSINEASDTSRVSVRSNENVTD
jgi:hypothetical protein